MSSARSSEPVSPPAVRVREGYDRWAEVYDIDGNPLIALEAPEVQRMLGEVRGLDVADVGAGTGRHSIRLVAAGANVVALDLSEGMISAARAKPGIERVRYVIADCGATLPLRDRSFDRVLTCLLADHVASLDLFFAELRRICRRGGFIVLSTVHPAMHLRGVRARFTDPASGQKIYPVSYEFAISDYVMAARRAGLTFDEICERAFDEAQAAKLPRAAQYAGWPMLLAMRLSPK
ncbi:MAG: methyltransferase domain-containing protein [Candidatus Binatus sp.]|uniref:class I SAM-dependent methyltransferase n=1 Tax=Candidatus Binatus sp. TaxID=2811406 RepID=UPI002717CDBA|nr:methyltransferase domain-containing protein [Candidatus Binatus sp.]MDO8434403.1 methyltransferase domain-containing protein [Candidatus Binatus sp.]